MIILKTVAILGMIAVSILTGDCANAKDFKIGEVKKKLPTTFCGSYLPNQERAMVLFQGDLSKYAWININGSDIQLTKTRTQYIKSQKRTISNYQGKNITLIWDSRNIRTIEGAMETDESSDRVTFNVGNRTKTIQTKGSCS